MNYMKICHLTSAHPLFDSRIFYKECKTLVHAGYHVALIAQNENNEICDGVQIYGVAKTNKRSSRLTYTLWHVYKLAMLLDADIYHFHDPELIVIGLLLRAQGKLVIYDVHEDVPLQILNKHWIPRWLRKFVAQIVKITEKISTYGFNGIVAATPQIGMKFPEQKTVIVQNFPRFQELNLTNGLIFKERSSKLVYIGRLSAIRGIKEIVSAMELLPQTLNAQLILAGVFDQPIFHTQLQQIPGYKFVNFVGWKDQSEIRRILSTSQIGLVTLYPTPNFLESYPIKLFEYMAAGIPVIASDFPLWRQIISEAECGLLVDPLDPKAIAQAITWLLEHQNEAQAMGQRGRRAIEKQFNWSCEESKLLQFYEKIIN